MICLPAGMAAIAEPLRPARVLARPKRYAPLRAFSCGRQGRPWEKIVNEWARDLYLGAEADAQTVLVLEDAAGRLIGLCGLKPEPLPIPAARLAGGAQRIDMIATDRLYHGRRLRDGSRPGDALLAGALEHVKAARDGRMPYVWALVSPANAPSHALFDRHGFGALPYRGEGEIIRVRPPHRRLPVVALRLPGSDRNRLTRWISRRAGKRQT